MNVRFVLRDEILSSAFRHVNHIETKSFVVTLLKRVRDPTRRHVVHFRRFHIPEDRDWCWCAGVVQGSGSNFFSLMAAASWNVCRELTTRFRMQRAYNEREKMFRARLHGLRVGRVLYSTGHNSFVIFHHSPSLRGWIKVLFAICPGVI